jgi:glyoxylase-like metal-dependent hydrolase (beta-lactamase superfamily II)
MTSTFKTTAAALVTAGLLTLSSPLHANENIADQYPDSLLYSKPVEVIPNVWTSIGATAPPTYENAGHNNNLSFLVTGDGVIVINGGGSYGLAEALHKEIKEVTDQPVKLVVNENGQGHAALGNCYWAKQGVKIIAHEDAAHEFEQRSHQIMQAAEARLKDRAANNCVKVPDETFSDKKDVSMGNMKVELLHLGPAHSPGDMQVWLPEEKLVIAGDMAFHERLLPIFDDTDTASWVETWENEFEKLGAIYVIPGHGHPTNMAQVRRYTHDYLVYLRGKIREHIDGGGGLDEAFYVDQSQYKHLHTFKELATKNAGRVFQQMEFE